MLKIVIIASTNPVKVHVAELAFSAVWPDEQFEFISMEADSGVADQPFEDATRTGARNRLQFIRAHKPEADFWLAQEGGLFTEGDKIFNRAWIAVTDTNGYVAESTTANFYLPKTIVDDVRAGMELATANDKFFGSVNSKHGLGAVGHLTDGVIDRTHYYLQAAIIALSELKHQDWYK